MATTKDANKKRVEKLARQIAQIIHTNLQQEGKLKPSYMSPKFWAVVQIEIKKLEEDA